MKLVIFDIDGTLTRTNEVDEECYVRAFEEECGFTGIDTDWSTYPSYTDTAIALELYARHQGREPGVEEIDRVRRRFFTLLESAFAGAPHQFTEIPGAAEALRRLRRDPGYRVALATGAWEPSARLKLRGAGLEVNGLPLATSDDSPLREEVVRRAISLAEAEAGPFESVVSVGDGLWDFQVARALGLGFIGVASGERADRLRRAGAGMVIESFLDLDRFIKKLDQALVPS
jgi:phosphoglycolate phosphatase-like HAD superfamily hydrolase